MGIDDCSEVNLSGPDKRAQSRNHTTMPRSVTHPWECWEALNVLLGICGVNNDGVFGFLVDDKVRIVVALPPSCIT